MATHPPALPPPSGPSPTLVPLLDVAATRAAEADTGVASIDLIERAGVLAARAILAMFAPASAVVACGAGNNGGDGYVVARHLAGAGVAVTVAATAEPRTGAAAAMRLRWGGAVVPLTDAAPAAVLVDAVVGSGRSRPLDAGVVAELARLAAKGRVAALDVPSGLDADSGSGACLAADRCGRVVVAGLGFDTSAARLFACGPPRPLAPARDANKYSRGAVIVLGGEHGGAARLAAHAAVRAGAGLALVACPATAVAENAARLDAVMVRAADDGDGVRAALAAQRFAAGVVGPGLAADDPRLSAMLASGLPLVLDAGVFLAFAGAPDRLAAALTGPAVLTPHAGEFARVFGAAEGDRIAAVRAAAARVGAVVLLKGAATVIAAPDGRAAINAHATPWLATAGSGDTLSGIVAALLAQGFAPFEAACAGAWLHGDAGRGLGAGLTADDLAVAVGHAVAAL